MQNIKLTQIVNAGLLIEGNGKKILIDAIHCEKTHEWSTVTDELMDYMIYGSGKFKDINFLLFTHCHKDHFNAEKTFEYIRNNKAEMLITPKLGDSDCKSSGLLKELDTDYYQIGTVDMDNLKISYLRTKHLAHEKVGIDHYVYIVEIDKKIILFLGDADFCKAELAQSIKDISADVLVAPFIVVNSTLGRKFVENINPRILILNHLPGREDDSSRYRGLTDRNIEKFEHMLPETIIFQNLYDEAHI
ncbi:MAG: MBL fold metallo-hydrolase [Sedimentibacter sp.]|uniref:MBL fold metallo-hydrolase n=1 Tax=Sedimentibacter sp. TaxID=1960295 RepID=UPI00315833AA